MTQGCLRDSHLLDELEVQAFSPTGEAMCLYGDPAYPHRIHSQGPFKEPNLTPATKEFSNAMSSVRTSVDGFLGCHWILQISRFQKTSQNLSKSR